MTATHALGRVHVAEPPHLLSRLHMHDGRPLRAVDHEPPLAVLDQEDLVAQGIDTSALISGAPKVDALGSCVFNATTAALSGLYPEDRFASITGAVGYHDTVGAEKYAITLYDKTTHLTGDPSSEWPPTDCGSSGVYVCQELEQQKVIGTHKTAVGADNVVSLLQDGVEIVGQPWFQAGFDVSSANGYFIDGNGTQSDLLKLIHSGMAGGHETVLTAIEKLALTETGAVDAEKTICRFRNSWGSWGDHGSYRIHLSSYLALGSYVDFRQLVAA